MRSSRSALFLLLAGLAARLPAGRSTIQVREDGMKVIINEPSEARSRRLSDRLLADAGPGCSPRRSNAMPRERDLEPRLVQAVVQVESGYNRRALSNKGAMGLMQLMPGTASELAVADPWDPRPEPARRHQLPAPDARPLRRPRARARRLQRRPGGGRASTAAFRRTRRPAPTCGAILHLFDGSDADARREPRSSSSATPTTGSG